MDLREKLMGGWRPDPRLRDTFAKPGTGPVKFGDLMATFNGFGRDGRGREWGLDGLQRVGIISAEQRAARGAVRAASEGASAVVDSGGRQAFAAGATGIAGGARVSSNPIYGGLYAQMLRERGFQVPAYVPEAMPAAARAAVTDDVVEAAIPAADDVAAAVDSPVAAAADDAAARIAQLEQRFIDGFQRLAALPEEQRMPALLRAVDAGKAAGHGNDAFGVLAETLASRPLQHSTDALHTSIDDAAKLAAKATAAAAKSAPVVDEAAKAAPVVDEAVKVARVVDAAKVAPVADHPAIVAARQELADDLRNGTLQFIDDANTAVLNTKLGAVQLVHKADLAAALGGAPSTADDVARALPKALPVADDALRNGLKGVMSFNAGLDDTIRLLAKF